MTIESISLADLEHVTGGVTTPRAPHVRVQTTPKAPITAAPAPAPTSSLSDFARREPFAWSNMMSGGNI
jgi:hypothetical protein